MLGLHWTYESFYPPFSKQNERPCTLCTEIRMWDGAATSISKVYSESISEICLPPQQNFINKLIDWYSIFGLKKHFALFLTTSHQLFKINQNQERRSERNFLLLDLVQFIPVCFKISLELKIDNSIIGKEFDILFASPYIAYPITQ